MVSVILNHTPAEVIRRALIQLGLVSEGIAYVAWPVFTEMEPDKPDNLVTLYDTDGLVQTRYMNTGETQENYGVQVRVRATRALVDNVSIPGARIARNKIDDIVQTLDQQCCRYVILVPDELGTGTTSYMLHSANRTSGVLRVGRQPNNSERYIYTVNYLMSLTIN